MRFSQAFIDDLRTQVDLVALVERYYQPLKRKGANHWAISPFASEKTPSFSVNPKKGIWKCFSSGLGGDAFKFLQEKEGMSFRESVKAVAEFAGVEVPEDTPEQQEASAKRESLKVLMSFAAKHYRGIAGDWQDWWLMGKGFTTETRERFQTGASTKGWSDFFDKAAQNGFSPEALVEVGLARYSEKTGKYYDVFRNRAMFPIWDRVGNVIAFGGRKADDDEEQQGKYVNSAENPLYDKSATLYALHLAKDAIREKGFVYLVEGYTDVMAMHQVGLTNTVATCGTALTARQVAELSRFCAKVVIAYDGDTPGQAATAKAIDQILSAGLDAEVLDLEGDDPNDIMKKGEQERLSKPAQDWMAWMLKHLEQWYDKDKVGDRIHFFNRLKETIDLLPFDYAQEIATGMLRERLGMEAAPAQPAPNSQSDEIEVQDSPISNGPRDWTYYQTLQRRLGFQHVPDFGQSGAGDLIVKFMDLSGKPIKADGKELIGNVTRGETVNAVYIPRNLREYSVQADRPDALGVPLFLTEDPLTAWVMDQMGIFCLGLTSRDGFVAKKNSKKLHPQIRQVMTLGFRHVVYLSAAAHALPQPKTLHNPKYEHQDASAIARDYVGTMQGLKEAFGETNAHFLHLNHHVEHIAPNHPRWIEAMLQEICGPTYAPYRERIEAEFAHELYSMLSRREEPSEFFECHNISDNNLNFYQKVMRISDAQTFFDFHGADKLGLTFQFGKHIYEADRNNQVLIREEALGSQYIREMDGCYWADQKTGLKRISDFVFQPRLKIKGTSPYVLTTIRDRYAREYDIVLDDKLLLDSNQLHLRVFGLADCFFHGTAAQLRHIQENSFKNMPTAVMADKLGHQTYKVANSALELYVLGNGVISYDDGFIAADEKGLLSYANQTFFLPAFSEYDLHEDRDEVYGAHQAFSYEPGSITLDEYLPLLFKVHMPEYAHTGFMFYVASLFRDICYKAAGNVFPNCYFQGFTGSGKSTLRKSLSRLHGEVPTVMINSNPTAASVGSLPRQTTNSMVVLEEFNVFRMVQSKQEWIIDTAKAMYDGKGRATRQNAHTENLRNKPTTAALLALGQEHFYTYDEAVNNRFIVIEWPEKPIRDFEEFNRLKVIEEGGVSHLTSELLKHRAFIKNEYRDRLREVEQYLREKLTGQNILDRLIQNWAIVCTPILMLIRAGLMNYPYSPKEILDHAIEQIRLHSMKATRLGIMGEWWNYIATEYGRTLDDRMVFLYTDGDTPELRIRYKEAVNGFIKYVKDRGDKSVEIPSKNNLQRKLKDLADKGIYIKDETVYMGYVRNADGTLRYKAKVDTDGNATGRSLIYAKQYCMRFYYNKLVEEYGLQLTEIRYDEGEDDSQESPAPAINGHDKDFDPKAPKNEAAQALLPINQ